LGLVRRWIEAETADNIFCTIKFQGETDHAIIAEFKEIQGAILFHSSQNKHEVTFARLAP
jgi:23S rRNA (cytidine2498-2'-O)-methyltransferase